MRTEQGLDTLRRAVREARASLEAAQACAAARGAALDLLVAVFSRFCIGK